ncbi:response regulator transcription factor [Flavivirga sp. 57AJ16]|uniref:response regulator n=1 Tax=Flavivirga sp. 57AJ16 TaxID=3025307 RepID=UPI0023661CF2|nr:response regulator transcription factor [Flavivirga sp. 57AJ16]MDD7886227.1 response regulator transcription factor [Flavivirga sp. 57AJ16]
MDKRLKQNISIVIADDHPLLLKGLFEELSENNYNIVGQANNGVQVLELIVKQCPDLALLDIDMPMLNAFEIIGIVKEKQIDTKFILLSFHKEKDYVTQAKALNINGYLLKEDSFMTIEKCILSVVNGGSFFSPSLDENSLLNADNDLRLLSRLTGSEKKILKLISDNFSSNDIANHLNVSLRTIDKHRSNIINKLELKKTTNSLTNWALIHKNILTLT